MFPLENLREVISRNNRRRSYTSAEKLALVARLKAGESFRNVSTDACVDRKSLRRWKAQEQELMALTNKRSAKRLNGGGRKAFYPEIEEKLLQHFQNEREQCRSVTYTTLKQYIRSPAFGIPIPAEFKVSDKYIYGWTKRHKISSRRITHRGHLSNRSQYEVQNMVQEYFTDLYISTVGMPASKIFNMDEVPCYFDMSRDHTLHFAGSKNVDGADTGYRKQWYTVCLAISLSGHMLPPMIMFRGLKKPPKVTMTLGQTAIVYANKSCSMDSKAVFFWLDNVFSKRGNYFSNTRSILVWDQAGAHKKAEVVEKLQRIYGTNIVLLPLGSTHFSQPFDVEVNGTYKAALKNAWDEWIKNTNPEYTKKGYRKRPSYQAIVNMVLQSVETVSSNTIRKAFECCGIAPNGEQIPNELFNERLQNILNLTPNLISFEDAQFETEEVQSVNSDDEELVERGDTESSDTDSSDIT